MAAKSPLENIQDDPFENSELRSKKENGQRSNEPEDETQSILFHELNFFPIPSQSNVYGLTNIVSENTTKLLVATLSGEIYSLKFNQQSVQSTMKAVGFSYIPALAEIVSIDMFSTENSGPIVGVTLIIKKDAGSPKEVFFNIYGQHTSPTDVPDWERIGEDWQTLILKYTPFLLTHTTLLNPSGRGSETVFLISGDDCKVHMYRLVNELNEEIRFEESHSESFFPEFEGLSSSVTNMDMIQDDCSPLRLTAFGCQNGYIKCSQVDRSNNCMLWSCDNTFLDGPITSVRLFRNHTHKDIKDGVETVHLLVASAIEMGCVFIDVLQSELKEPPLMLPSSNGYDSVLCTEVADIDWDRQNELILGTYGKKLLVYNIDCQNGNRYETSLKYSHQFAHPIHRIMYRDITGDGLRELVVLTTAGIHILQHDLCQVSQLLDSKLTSTTHL